MLKNLMKKVDNMQKQVGDINREMETLGKKLKEMLEIKSTITEMKNALMGSSIDWSQPGKNQQALRNVNRNF